MKQTYLFCLLFVSLFSSAQIINFTSINFRTKLLAASPSNTIAKDLSGNYFKIDANNDGEIEVSEALNVSYLSLNSAGISNIEGINNFSNLKKLYIGGNNPLTNLDASALVNLEVLHCTLNSLTNLNVSGLTNLLNLDFHGNMLTNVDVSSLTNLQVLNCTNNQLTNLDLNGLTHLTYLFCGANQFTNLNLNNLTNLSELNCEGGQLTNLSISGSPNLNFIYASSCQMQTLNLTGLTNLGFLDCSNNQLSSLNLDQSLIIQSLYCSNNQITSLNLPLTLLTHLNCEYNNLTSLNVSQCQLLGELYCNNNQLTALDVSQNPLLNILYCNNNQIINLDLSQNYYLIYLYCNNNNLQTLNIKNGHNEYFDYNPVDQIPPSSFQNNPNLQYICADESQINDIQTKITEYGYTNCHVNTYCSFTPGGEFYTIQGQQKFDNENDNCDATDDFIPNFKYSITDGTTTGSIISNNTGLYSIPVQAGSYTITPILENPTYFTVSQTNIVVDFPTQTSPFTQDFCITPNGIHNDVEVSIIPTNVARPGFDSFYKIIYRNKGNQVENGTINFQFNDSILDLVTSNPTFTTQTTNNLSFDYNNLNPFETREISIVLNVNSPMETPAVNSGDILNYTATNTISNTDEMLSDNTFVLNQIVVNSLDPNDKTCLEGNTISPDKVGGYVHYMIRFENTGTFPAENIVVKDMIDTAKFNVSSLIPLNASHNYVTKISGNKVEFIFENINLPFDDANNDGYIAFKIKTLPTLVVGNTFSNSANIYFDYNFPIVTNTATTTIAALNNPSFDFANYFSLYPNPTTNELNINLKSAVEINSIQIYNTIGQLVTVQTGNALKVDVSNLKNGNYFIKINTNEGFSTSQFIKE